MCSMANTRLRMLATANVQITDAIAEIEEAVALGGGLYEALPGILEKLTAAAMQTAVSIKPATALQIKHAKAAAQQRAATIAAHEARRKTAFARGEQLPLELEGA